MLNSDLLYSYTGLERLEALMCPRPLELFGHWLFDLSLETRIRDSALRYFGPY